MIYKPKNRRYYRVKFMWQGQPIRKCTRATNAKTARNIEAKIRSELAEGNWGILVSKPSPTLREFMRKDFLPYIKSRFQVKPKTMEYYIFGTRKLLASDLANLKLKEITGQHAGEFEARHSNLSPSTINCGLRTLRRALSLAVEWGKLDRMTKISLAKGERQRERVLTNHEAEQYLEACPQPWRDVATVMLGTGMCPGELYDLRWECVLLDGTGGVIQVLKGKVKARRRLLRLLPWVHQALKSRHDAQGRPVEGWVFPTKSKSGHFEQGAAKGQHARALKTSGVKPFEPYCLRHTGLTWLGEDCDAFTLSKIAGHSSIVMTQRYCHPQADAIEKAFQRMGERRKLVTDGGHQEKPTLVTSEKK